MIKRVPTKIKLPSDDTIINKMILDLSAMQNVAKSKGVFSNASEREKECFVLALKRAATHARNLKKSLH